MYARKVEKNQKTLSYLYRPLKYLLSCLQGGVWNLLDYEARYGPTKCPPLPYETPDRSPVEQSLWGAVEWRRGCRALQCKAVGCSTQRAQVWGGSTEPAAQGRSSRAPGASLGSGGLQHWPVLCPDTAATLQISTDAASTRCGRTHSTFCAQPLCAVTHWGAGTKTNQQGKPKSSITQNLQKQDCSVRCGTYGGFHWLCFRTFLLLRDPLLVFESPHGPEERLGGSEPELW